MLSRAIDITGLIFPVYQTCFYLSGEWTCFQRPSRECPLRAMVGRGTGPRSKHSTLTGGLYSLCERVKLQARPNVSGYLMTVLTGVHVTPFTAPRKELSGDTLTVGARHSPLS